jgi:hypothetical protein
VGESLSMKEHAGEIRTTCLILCAFIESSAEWSRIICSPLALLQENRLLDLPKLLDICAIYGHDNGKLTSSLVGSRGIFY